MNIVIMAGGSGTRFWPMSRSSRPKQMLDIIGGKPMLRATYDRVKDLAPDERILLVVGREHLAETRKMFHDTSVRIIAEPFGRNTAPCVGVAVAFLLRHLGSDAPAAILPADHYVAQPEEFRETLREAASQASAGGIVTLGILPTRPETGYGYIERDPQDLGGRGKSIHRVLRFVEKPDVHTAERYLASGNFYWNAGIFVSTPGVLLEEFASCLPRFHEGLEDLHFTEDPLMMAENLTGLYRETENISFDYAIMEKTSRPVFVMPCACGWSDVGSWYSLYDVRGNERDTRGNLLDGDALLEDCTDSFVVAKGGRWIAAIGLHKVLIVDTKDSLLVADLERSQEVRKVTEHLRGSGDRRLL